MIIVIIVEAYVHCNDYDVRSDLLHIKLDFNSAALTGTMT